MAADEKKPIAITMGDVAGVGPEVIVKALAEGSIYDICRPVVIGDARVLHNTISMLKSPVQSNPVASAADVTGVKGTIDILDLKNLDDGFEIGQVSEVCGRAAMEFIEKAAALCMNNEVAAMVTAPINKEAIMLAGYHDTGHMRFLTRITKTTEYAAMLATGNLKVVHLSDHYPLREAPNFVKQDRILAKLRLIRESYLKWGQAAPRIGVAGLNPHNSDGGMFGSEEADEIAPAVEAAKAEGIDARGPYPGDSIFYRAIGGEFDVVLAMYHDQGHIAVKTYGFEKSYTVTLGLPFVRTSVDHGTAFDIAGKGIADHQSMIEAVKVAVELTQ